VIDRLSLASVNLNNFVDKDWQRKIRLQIRIYGMCFAYIEHNNDEEGIAMTIRLDEIMKENLNACRHYN